MTRPAPIKDPRAAFIKQSVSDRDRARLGLAEPKRTFDLEAAERILATLIGIAPRGVVQEAMPVLWETIVSRLGKGEVPSTPADFEGLLRLGLDTYRKRKKGLDAAERALITIPKCIRDRIKKAAKAAGLDLENEWDFDLLDPADRELWPVFCRFDENKDSRRQEEIDEAVWSTAGESWAPAAPWMDAIPGRKEREFLKRLAELGGGELTPALVSAAAVSLGYSIWTGPNRIKKIKLQLDQWAARGQA